MYIKPCSMLRNDYKTVSALARDSGEPIFITINGEEDGVYLSLESFERMEQQLLLRSRILATEEERLNGGKTYTREEMKQALAENR